MQIQQKTKAKAVQKAVMMEMWKVKRRWDSWPPFGWICCGTRLSICSSKSQMKCGARISNGNSRG